MSERNLVLTPLQEYRNRLQREAIRRQIRLERAARLRAGLDELAAVEGAVS